MIDFALTEHQEEIKVEAADFARRIIAPRAEQIDRQDTFPMEVWAEMGKKPYRYCGMHIPEEYGGYPRPLLDKVIVIEELTAAGQSPVCTILMEMTGLGTVTIVNNASEELKKSFLPSTARGEAMGCFSLTEPGTGSDASGIHCYARKEGNEYIINGRKRYTSFASQSAYVILFARTDSGISAFIVPTDVPGYQVLERIECIGLRGHRDEELEFKDCRIPAANLIGQEGKGLNYGMVSLDETRTTLNAGFIGLARACLDEAVNYARSRSSFGRELFHRQAMSYPLAEIAVAIDAARLLNYRAAWLHDQGKKHTVETAKAKVLATKTMLDAANMAVEVHGGFGCTKRHKVERFYRDARIWAFAQGTAQIMKFIINRELFGKYNM